MTNTIPNVSLELLERASNLAFQTQHYPLHEELRTLLSTPSPANHVEDVRAMVAAQSPAGVDGLEVVGYFFQHEETGNVMSVDAQQVDWGFEANNPRLHRVCALTDYDKAQASIDGLRGENERIRLNIAEYNEAISCYQSERDQQAQRIGELEGLLRSCLPALSDGGCAALANRIAATLSAGKEGE